MLNVIMPVYNVERYLGESIESVLAQTHRDFVLHVCDDGSKDGTLKVAQSYAAKDSRVRVTTGPNAGIANVINSALARCQCEGPEGDWIAIMHGDDVMLPNRFERQLAFVKEHPEVSLISSVVEWIDENGKIVGRTRSDLTTPELVKQKLESGGFISFTHPAVMFRKSAVEAVGGYRQIFWPSEDLELWNRMADAGYGVLVQDEILLRYRVMHSSSASGSKTRLMVRKIRWMEICANARRAGKPEPTWEEFLQWRRGSNLLRTLREARWEHGRVAYHQAVAHFAARRFVRFVPAFMVMTAFEPSLVFDRVYHKAGKVVRKLVPGRRSGRT